MTTTSDPVLNRLNRLLGSWVTEATHPALPGVVVQGTAIMEWLEGERFLILRSRTDHPDFPDGISIIGFTGRDRGQSAPSIDQESADKPQMRMHYFDSRGVSRIYEATIDDESWRVWRDAPGFSQRFSGAFADGGDTIVGRWQMCQDEVHWNDDLEITYRRSK